MYDAASGAQKNAKSGAEYNEKRPHIFWTKSYQNGYCVIYGNAG